MINDDDNRSVESWDGEPSAPDAKEITDEEIANLPVQELNKLLRNVPWEEAARIRKRRRQPEKSGILPELSAPKTARARRSDQRKYLVEEEAGRPKMEIT